MAYPLIISPEAEAEVALARDRYEEQRLGLGREFLEQVSFLRSLVPAMQEGIFNVIEGDL